MLVSCSPFGAESLSFRLAGLAVVTATATDEFISIDADLIVFSANEPFTWNVVPDFLKISDIGLNLFWDHVADVGPLCAVSGVANLLDLKFATSYGAADRFRCRLLKAAVTASDVLRRLSDDSIHLPDAVNFTLAALDFVYKPFLEWKYFLLTLDGAWPLLGKALVLERVILEYGTSYGVSDREACERAPENRHV